MGLESYKIDRRKGILHLYFDDSYEIITLNKWTGRIYQRPKDNFALKYLINHKGLYIGQDCNGTHMLVHSHIDAGLAEFITWEDFGRGMEVVEDTTKNCTNDRYGMIESVLDQVISGEPYDLHVNSCQTLVNQACTNETKNDDIGKVVAGLFSVVAVLVVADALLNSNGKGLR
jgi:hypothetical protein